MRIESINLSPARAVTINGRRVMTGIFKRPVDGRVAVRPLGLLGDEQADLTVHGGLGKAIYAYPQAHYRFWQTVRAQAGLGPAPVAGGDAADADAGASGASAAEARAAGAAGTAGTAGTAGDPSTRALPAPPAPAPAPRQQALPLWDGAVSPLAPGALGENLTLSGMVEADVWIGDLLRFPDCTLAVSEPRLPCFKFNAAMGFDQAAKLMVQSGWCGFYLAVRVPGTLQAGEPFEVIAGPREVGIGELFRARTAPKRR